MSNCKRKRFGQVSKHKNSSLLSYRNKTYVCPYKGIEQFFCNNLLTKSSSVLEVEPFQNAFSGHSSWNKNIVMYFSKRLRVENMTKLLSGRRRSRRSLILMSTHCSEFNVNRLALIKTPSKWVVDELSSSKCSRDIRRCGNSIANTFFKFLNYAYFNKSKKRFDASWGADSDKHKIVRLRRCI